MKRQEIFVALRKAGLTDRFEYRSVIEYDSSMRLEHFVELIAAKAAAAEREACAGICDRHTKVYLDRRELSDWESGYVDGATECFDAIRARGQE